MIKLLGIDIGTSAAKAIVIDEFGEVLDTAHAEYSISTPHPLWSEQNPEDWWQGVRACLQQLGGYKVDAIGLTGQMHGAVFLDGKMQVIRPAMLWNDQRTSKECKEIEETIGIDRYRSITLNPALTGFQLPKVVWLRNHEPENFAKVRHILLPKDYIRFRLTGELATDVSDASGVGALSVLNRTWSDEIFDGLGLLKTWFPQVFESAAVTGRADGIPVVAGGGDQAAGAVGTGAVVPGVVSASLGTSGVIFASLSTPKRDAGGSAHTFCHANGGWHSMGVMLSCGGSVKWVKELLYPNESYKLFDEEADSIEIGSDGLSFLPYLSGERCPFSDPLAKGAYCGIASRHGRSHFARATLEGVTFGLKQCFDLLCTLGVEGSEIRVTGGGAKSPIWVQMLADVLERPCLTLGADEGPSFGAAILAGVGIGIWSSVEEACTKLIRTKSRIEPSGRDYRPSMGRFESLYPALRSWFSDSP